MNALQLVRARATSTCLLCFGPILPAGEHTEDCLRRIEEQVARDRENLLASERRLAEAYKEYKVVL